MKQDLYARSGCLRYTLTVIVAVWILCFLAACVLMVNAKFHVSICEPGGGPCTGNIYTDQWTSMGWIATTMFGCSCTFFIMSYQMIAAFRQNRVCLFLWIVVMFLAWAVGMVSWVLLWGEFMDCNKPNHPENICTSLEACLVPEFFNDPVANGCPNSPFGVRTYTLSLSSIYPRADFIWLFSVVSFFNFVLNLTIIILVMILWFGFSEGGGAGKRKNG